MMCMRLTYCFALALLPAMAACHNEPTAPAPAVVEGLLGDRITLAVGQTATVAGTPLSVRFARVLSEGRCPSDVACIWQGSAEYVLEVRTAGAIADSLRVLQMSTYATGRFAQMGAYRYETVELAPYPRNGQIDLSRYQLTLRVLAAN
ncbi:MAG: hypothetical protein IT353_10505 [Gemmatimonadaceae bacterium]|nr:hypothetical protein [Gemmatimonadaceae bacterium]